MVPVAELAAAAVAALVPYLSAGAMEGAKKLGTATAERLGCLYDKVKARLTSPLGEGALAAIERAPTKADAQAALRLALEMEVAENPRSSRSSPPESRAGSTRRPTSPETGT
jgi:hypothetical protein